MGLTMLQSLSLQLGSFFEPSIVNSFPFLQHYWLGFTEKQKPYIYRGRDCPLFPKALLIFLEVIETQILAGYVAS